MNAQQRRKAYRKIDRLAGTRAIYVGKAGRRFAVTILGRTEPVSQMASSAWLGYTFDGGRASVHRVRCRRDGADAGASFAPRLSQLRAA
jgi:hypothetical protein